MIRTLISLTLYLLSCWTPQLLAASADSVYAHYAPSLYQIRIMETHSGSRAALGSGFVIGDGTLLATNYHVVSGKVMEPDKYRVEIDIKGQAVTANILLVDAIHDLAILSTDTHQPLGTALLFAPQPPQKGAVLYSLGNPHDIGMTVVEGNYNGRVEHSFVEQIHFSGAINSGMSGGPTINGEGQIVGINVATAGNQIGFLVPAEFLKQLLNRVGDAGKTSLLDAMASQIRDHTTAMLDDLLAQEWKLEPMGEVTIFAKTAPWVECWGNSDEQKERGTLSVSRGCNSGSQLFLADGFSSGYIEYEFFYFQAPKWPSTSVYRHMALGTANAMPGNKTTKTQAANYTCTNDWVKTLAGTTKRLSYCTRPYKRLPGLFDVFYVGVTTDRTNQVAMEHFTLAGVTREASLRFLARFKEQMTWQ